MNRSRINVSMFLLIGLMAQVTGCSVEPALIPDTGAGRAPDGPTQTMAEHMGVRVWLDGAAWRDEPPDLSRVMTPVKIAIENGSDKAVRIAYKDFALVGGSGFRYAAVAPLPGQTPVSERTNRAILQWAEYRPPHRSPPPPHRFPHRHFYLAPHYRHWWPHPFVWVQPFPHDPYAYGRFSWPRQLPSADMIAQALPEGVLQLEGHIEGFVYFQAVARRETRVTFEMDLVDAHSGTSFGKIQVPLRVLLP